VKASPENKIGQRREEKRREGNLMPITRMAIRQVHLLDVPRDKPTLSTRVLEIVSTILKKTLCLFNLREILKVIWNSIPVMKLASSSGFLQLSRDGRGREKRDSRAHPQTMAP